MAGANGCRCQVVLDKTIFDSKNVASQRLRDGTSYAPFKARRGGGSPLSVTTWQDSYWWQVKRACQILLDKIKEAVFMIPYQGSAEHFNRTAFWRRAAADWYSVKKAIRPLLPSFFADYPGVAVHSSAICRLIVVYCSRAAVSCCQVVPDKSVLLTIKKSCQILLDSGTPSPPAIP